MPNRLTRRGVCLALVLLAAWSGAGVAQSPAFPYRVELSPRRPTVGGELELDLVVQGLSARGMELSELSVGEGLSLESQSIGPFVEPDGSRGSQLRLVFRVLRAGRIAITRLVLRSKEGSLVAAPMSLVAEGPLSSSGEREEVWEWEAPEEVYRYEAFSLRLRDRAGEGPDSTSSDVTASFSVPEGASLEAIGPLAWTMTVLDAGTVALPDADMSRGGRPIGKAAGFTIRVREPPAEIGASRAIGRFELALEGLERTRPRAGDPFVFRLVLSGRGNLPVLHLSEPRLSLDGKALPAEDLASRRLDDSQPAAGGYEGRAMLELTVTPPSAGRLTISVPPIAALEPGAGLRVLSLEPVSLRVQGGLAGDGSAFAGDGASGGPFTGAEAAALRLAAASARLRSLPALLKSSRVGSGQAAAARRRALELLGPRLADDRDGRYLEAALRWESGERGPALALLYGLLRSHPGFADARQAAEACAGELGSGAPLLDALPPPLPFALGGILPLAASLFFFFAARRKRGPALAATAGLCLVLAAGSLALSGLSALERRRSYAVVWTDRLLVVPSPSARGYVELPLGSAARIRGAAPGYVGLVFGDGLAGWAPRESVYYY